MVALATTFFFVSITPGMCMTLALTLGMTVGVRRSLWMMMGELAGVGAVGALSILGVAALVLQYPAIFIVLKGVGAAYLVYLGTQLWRSRGKMAIDLDGTPQITDRLPLISQGFITAIANPKGWAFCIAILPPFVDLTRPLALQIVIVIGIILSTEFMSLLAYAAGGRSLGRLLQKSDKVKLLNRISGTLMMAVAVWLLVS